MSVTSIDGKTGALDTGSGLGFVGSTLELPAVVASLADIATTTIPDNLDQVLVLGYAAAGDGGQVLCKVVGSEPSHYGKAQSANGKWIEFVPQDLNILMFGGGASKLETENRTALEHMISTCDAMGGGYMYVPWPIDYGFVTIDPDTHPDFSGTTNDMMLLDRGNASAYYDPYPPSKQGFQERRFYGTVQTSPVGLHDGNGMLIRGKWHPYLWLENTAVYAAQGDISRAASDNLRTSLIWAYQGSPKWQLGIGQTEIGDVDVDHMMHFVLSAFDFTGTGRLTPYAVNYLTGAVNYSTGSLATKAAHWFKHEPLVTYAFPTVLIENGLADVGVTLRNSINLVNSATPVAAGTGYSVSNVLTVVSDLGANATLTVASINGSGGVTGVTVTNPGSYTIAPTNPVAVTGGGGTGATFNLGYADPVDVSITNNHGAARFSSVVATKAGTTAQRPTGVLPTGSMYFDTTLGVPVWWNATNWILASGVVV